MTLLKSVVIFLFTAYVYWYSKMQVLTLLAAMYYKRLKTNMLGEAPRYTKTRHDDDLYEVYDNHKDARFIFTYEPETHRLDEYIIQTPPFISLGVKYDGDAEYKTLEKWQPVLVKGNRVTKRLMRHISNVGADDEDKKVWLWVLDGQFNVCELDLDTHEIVLGENGEWNKREIA